jgi:hypothetical protein
VAGTTMSPFGNPERPRRPGFGSASPVPDAPHISSSFYRRSRLVATGAAAAGTHAVRKKGEKKRQCEAAPAPAAGTRRNEIDAFFIFLLGTRCGTLASRGGKRRRALAMPGPVHKRQGGKRRARLQCPGQCTRDRAAVIRRTGADESRVRRWRNWKGEGKRAGGCAPKERPHRARKICASGQCASACECSSLVLVSGSPARQPLGEPQITSHTAARV